MLTGKVRGFLTLVFVGAIGALVWSWGVEAAGGHDNGDSAFAKRLAGTYVGSGEGFLGMFTVHPDGTYTNTVGDVESGFLSTGHGVWKQIGRRDTAWTILFYAYDEDGVVEFVYRGWGVSRYSRDFSEAEHAYTLDVFLPDQDPLTDVPVASIPGTSGGRRLHVIE